MRRTRLSALLILAFLATLFAPVRMAWACPDGTPCVADAGHGFVCAGGRCAHRKSCCVAEQPARCKHGALPEASEPGSGSGALQAADDCRFSVTASPHLVAVPEQSGKLLGLSFHALPAPMSAALTIPVAPAAWATEYAPGYRRPPPISAAPSRGPPTV